MNPDALQTIVTAGESETVEFKKSTAQLTRAGETLCAFLNTNGGRVFIGITPEGRIIGQTVADSTLREVASMLSHLEPAAAVTQERVPLAGGQDVLVLVAPALAGLGPFTFDGRPYHRVGSTTSVLPRARYEERILQNVHPRHRWETMPAHEIAIDDLDSNEILRTVRLGIEAGRLPEATGTNIPEILDRFDLRVDGCLLNAAVVLFGSKSSLHYPQSSLRLARFKGTDKNEFADNRQYQGHAFHLLDEAMAFLHRHLPISGRFEDHRLERIEELLVPVPALRETIVNALCHRDYSHPGGAVSIAVFDDRVEIWNDGTLPFGLRPEDLKVAHASRPRNPNITNVFYRRGLIERWGRGTNRVVEITVAAGKPEPIYAEIAGSTVVTFPLVKSLTPHVTPHATPHVTPHVGRLIRSFDGEMSRNELMERLEIKDRIHFSKTYLRPSLDAKLVEMTLPDKPKSVLQRYRLTAEGRSLLP